MHLWTFLPHNISIYVRGPCALLLEGVIFTQKHKLCILIIIGQIRFNLENVGLSEGMFWRHK